MAEYSLNDAREMIGRDRREEEEITIIVGDNCVIVNGGLKISQKVPGNIMVLEDKFKSAYECKVCKGKGILKPKCLKCDGTGKALELDDRNLSDDKCYRCDGKGYRVENCAACNGKGVLLELPDQAKKRPTSGIIVSCGPDCNIYKLGDRVAYSNYTGHDLPFKGNTRLKVMAEKEAFVKLETVEGADESQLPEFSASDDPYNANV